MSPAPTPVNRPICLERDEFCIRWGSPNCRILYEARSFRRRRLDGPWYHLPWVAAGAGDQ